jgi:hypothetical protein
LSLATTTASMPEALRNARRKRKLPRFAPLRLFHLAKMTVQEKREKQTRTISTAAVAGVVC